MTVTEENNFVSYLTRATGLLQLAAELLRAPEAGDAALEDVRELEALAGRVERLRDGVLAREAVAREVRR